MKIPQVQYNKFFDGIASSKHIQVGFDNLVNCDVHSDIGSVTGQNLVFNDTSANVPNEPCVMAHTPQGRIYFFSTISGKIWRLVSGVYTPIVANSNSTGHQGAIWYNGYVRYWTQNKLGKFVEGTEANRNDNFATFANSLALAACEENLTLFITDGKYVASLNSSESFNPNALDIPPQYIGSAVTPDGLTNIIIGTTQGAYIQSCRAFVWDTYSDSYTLSDSIPEIGINCFIDCDDAILAQCGVNGKIYQWTGQQLSLWDNEFRDQTTTGGAWQKSTIFKTRPLVAVGNKIFSIYRKNSTMTRVLVQEYTATNTITSMCSNELSIFLSVATGVNISEDVNNPLKAVATIDTPEIVGAWSNVIVDYQSNPELIGIQTKQDGDGWIQQIPIIDERMKRVYFDGGLLDCNYLQGRVILNASGAISPVITNITIK